MRNKYAKKEILSLLLEEIFSLQREKKFLSEMLLGLTLEAPQDIRKKIMDFCTSEIHRLEMRERASLSFLYENFERGGYFYSAFQDYSQDYEDLEVEEVEEVVEEEEEEEEEE